MIALLLLRCALAQDARFDEADSAERHAERTLAAATLAPAAATSPPATPAPDPVEDVARAREALDAAAADRRRAQAALQRAALEREALLARRATRASTLEATEDAAARAHLTDLLADDDARLAALQRDALGAEAAVLDAGRAELAARQALEAALEALDARLASDGPPPREDDATEDLEQDLPRRQPLFDAPPTTVPVTELTLTLPRPRLGRAEAAISPDTTLAALAAALRASPPTDPALVALAAHEALPAVHGTPPDNAAAIVASAVRDGAPAIVDRAGAALVAAVEGGRGVVDAVRSGGLGLGEALRTLAASPAARAVARSWTTPSHRGTVWLLLGAADPTWLAVLVTEPLPDPLLPVDGVARRVTPLQEGPTLRLLGGRVEVR